VFWERMEVLRSRNAEVGLSSRGYASVYRQFNFPGVDQDREELLSACLDRLTALKEIEDKLAKDARTEEVMEAARAAELKHSLGVPSKGDGRLDQIFKDESTHFLLRVSLSKTNEQRDFFLKTESNLLASRLGQAGSEAVLSVLEDFPDMSIEVVKRAEMVELQVDLDAVARGPRRSPGSAGTLYYKVAFNLVPYHVAARRVLVRSGYAYVPENYLIDILVSQFRSSLSKSLADIAKTSAFMAQHQSFGPLLAEIQNHYYAIASEGHAKTSTLARGDLKRAELRNSDVPAGMPLCMANLMNKLKDSHHLKHGGRMQLGLFLKSCGLTMEESLSFWKDEFQKGSVASDRFDKQYAYSIRHTYGKEGRRKELSCYGCMKIINSTPGPGEHHGCPYKEFSEPRLKQSLSAIGVPAAEV